MILLLAGCFGLYPFRNEPPELLSVNGLAPEDEEVSLGDVLPGEVVTLELAVDDPEGDGVRIWFPLAPGPVDFPPDAREGTYTVPWQAAGFLALPVVLEDDRERPARSAWTIWLRGPIDTGLGG